MDGKEGEARPDGILSGCASAGHPVQLLIEYRLQTLSSGVVPPVNWERACASR